MTDLQASIDAFNDEYLRLHQEKERLFWETKMGLSDEWEAFERAQLTWREFVGDAGRLRRLRGWLTEGKPTEEQRAVLEGWIALYESNVIEDADAREIQRRITGLENQLEQARGRMELGYVDPRSGEKVRATSVVLSNILRADGDEARRRAAWDGLRTIGDFVTEHGFCEVAVERNRLARALGHEDYYDYKVQITEGFGKATLFELLDDLERRTRDAARGTLETLARSTDADGTKPWNQPYLTAGSLAAERDPYFRFEDSLERWGKSFARLGIRYRQAKVTLDLLDRAGKYENGFMHGPTPPFVRRGDWLPAEINFTSNAVPSQPGSGYVATKTLFHEGGHAAHFANIVTGAPCFSQEFAPTSVALAETQSMFLDSLVDDADWQTRYARNEAGEPIPFELIERSIRLSQPSKALEIRKMLMVCYFEKTLYELPEAEVTPERVRAIAADAERRLLFFEEGSPRPVLSIPHILAGEGSCYYHGYVLADMAVAQTRAFFRDQHGHLLDHPEVGPALEAGYWRPGNALRFLDAVERVTMKPLSADALVARATHSADDAVAQAREQLDQLPDIPEPDEPVELDLDLGVIHGAETVVRAGTPFDSGAERFREWVRARA